MNKKVINTILKIINMFLMIIFVILFIIATFLAFYIITNKISEKANYKAPIRFYTIVSPSMEPEIKVYDIIISKKVTNEDDLDIGDVITFYSKAINTGKYTVTHRIHNIEIENGKKFPSPELIEKIASVLTVAPYVLFMDSKDVSDINLTSIIKKQNTDFSDALQKSVHDLLLSYGFITN